MFNLVGLGGFLLQIGAITVLTRAFGWSPVVATLVALELAALQNFIGHSRWTWGDAPVAGVRSWLTRYWRYQVAKTASLGANLAMTTGLIYLRPASGSCQHRSSAAVCLAQLLHLRTLRLWIYFPAMLTRRDVLKSGIMAGVIGIAGRPSDRRGGSPTTENQSELRRACRWV